MLGKSDKKSFFEREREEIKRLEKKGSRNFLRLYDFSALSLRNEIRKHPAQFFFLFVTAFLGSVITSSIALLGLSANILAQFASPKLQVKADPPKVVSASKVVKSDKFDHLLLASKIKEEEGDIVIVDIREKKEFDKGHIATAVNIPVYGSNIVTPQGDHNAEAILLAFEKLDKDKMIVIYAQNAYSTLPSEIALLLEKSGRNSKALAIGWEEWEHLYDE